MPKCRRTWPKLANERKQAIIATLLHDQRDRENILLFFDTIGIITENQWALAYMTRISVLPEHSLS